MKTILWDEIKPIIDLYTIWAGNPEIGWFCKAWKSLDAAGLTSYSNDVDRHWVLIRAIALGAMYGDYCDLEWDEYFEGPGTTDTLNEYEGFSHVRLGAMAADALDPDDLDELSLFASAIDFLVSEVRLGVYDALIAGFGGPVLLYAALWGSRCPGTNFDDLEPLANELFDGNHFLIKGRFEAFSYVLSSGMLAKDD